MLMTVNNQLCIERNANRFITIIAIRIIKNRLTHPKAIKKYRAFLRGIF